jgi:NtrC-family two-component system response regulator AlgB
MSHQALRQTPVETVLPPFCNLQDGPCKTREIPTLNILVVDDEPNIRRTVKIALESIGHPVTDAGDGPQALELLSQRPFEVAFLDVRLGREQGLDLLPEMLRLAPDLQVIVVTAYPTIENVVEAMWRGAADYVLKPMMPDQLRVLISKICQRRRMKAHVDALEEQVSSVVPEPYLQTLDATLRRELDTAFRAAASNATILLLGESGTGKEVLARAIHADSPQAHAPLVTVRCPSVSAESIAGELFGQVRGASGGAVCDTPGRVQSASGGILFLDEIGDLPLAVQPKLLRLLEEQRYQRVGETGTRVANVRLLAATGHDLEADVAAGRFRRDLFYQLSAISITLPPLRQRKADILPLARHLLAFFARQRGKPIASFTPEAEAALLACSWPGNARELRAAIERALIFATGPAIGLEDLSSPIIKPPRRPIEVGAAVTLEQLEAEHIRQILSNSATLEDAAKVLGIDPSTLFRKRKRGIY